MKIAKETSVRMKAIEDDTKNAKSTRSAQALRHSQRQNVPHRRMGELNKRKKKTEAAAVRTGYEG